MKLPARRSARNQSHSPVPSGTRQIASVVSTVPPKCIRTLWVHRTPPERYRA